MTAEQYEKIIALHNAVWLAESNEAALEANQAFLTYMVDQMGEAAFMRSMGNRYQIA